MPGARTLRTTGAEFCRVKISWYIFWAPLLGCGGGKDGFEGTAIATGPVAAGGGRCLPTRLALAGSSGARSGGALGGGGGGGGSTSAARRSENSRDISSGTRHEIWHGRRRGGTHVSAPHAHSKSGRKVEHSSRIWGEPGGGEGARTVGRSLASSSATGPDVAVRSSISRRALSPDPTRSTSPSCAS